MSYDLYFEAGRGKTLDKKSFQTYFKSRANYQVGNGQALYQNEDTGVYFIFDEPEDGVVAFNLNFFRPHVFGLEAAPELEQFSKSFATRVADPQGGMEVFSTEAFLRGWNDGNRFAYRSMMKDQNGPIHTWPAKKIREVWEWNYNLAEQRQREGENIFTPTIFAIDVDGEACSVAIWPPDCAILMPAVDAVMVPLAQSGKESDELGLVKWEEVFAVARPYLENAKGLKRYRMAFKEWPSDVAGFLGKKRKAVGELKGIGMDEILDREMVQESKAAGRQ
ncbi:MAG TPA: hypothetical protein VGP99_01155 [Tepidisphaeraceae bacterium]|jgi:hypothetical protein|nr:hypothetical protein [Tepidisphaeraceae bacterium]